MQKQFSNLLGVILIGLGALSLALNLLMPQAGSAVWHWTATKFWPLPVIGVGLLFLLLPFLMRGKRGWGSLFIFVGMPTLTSGGILLLANLSHGWNVWEWLWPVNVLGMALGFLLAAVYLRSIWLVAPAIIIGINGVVLQFCALTHLWAAWAVLWPVEPLAVGLALLAVSLKTRATGLFVSGLILCALGGLGLMLTTVLLSAAGFGLGLGVLNLVGPVVLMLVGGLMLAWNAVRRTVGSSLI
jgi:hypothetical protein